MTHETEPNAWHLILGYLILSLLSFCAFLHGAKMLQAGCPVTSGGLQQLRSELAMCRAAHQAIVARNARQMIERQRRFPFDSHE